MASISSEFLHQIVDYTKILFSSGHLGQLNVPAPSLATLLGMTIFICYEITQYFSQKYEVHSFLPVPIRGCFYATLIFITIAGLSNVSTQFIYFQF